jgi:uncharacterized membrane protein YdjX (TVP38/TMEM64 family)
MTEKPDIDNGGLPLDEEKPRGVSFADKLKFAGLIAFGILLVVIGVAFWPYFEKFATEEGRLELISMILGAGAFGVLICLGLQFLQIVVAFIPGEFVQLVIGAIYGPFWGTVVTALGALISTIFVYFVVHRLGAPFVHSMISKKHADKLRFFQESRRLDTIVFILFLIPGLPKDIFTYLVPLTDMKAVNFFVLSTLGRIPGIAASSYIGNAVVQGDIAGAVIVGVIAGGIGLLGIVFNGRIMDFIEKLQARFK